MTTENENFIFKMEVKEVTLPKKMDWLSDWEDDFDEDDFKVNRYEVYFATFEEMSEKIDEITVGYYQFWADVSYDIHENNNESLEYHSGHGVWDKEININTSRVYLNESFWKAIELYK